MKKWCNPWNYKVCNKKYSGRFDTTSEHVKEKEIKGVGKIYNKVTINYPPAGGFYKGPVPFTCIVAQMDDEILIPGHLTGIEPEKVEIGDRIKVVVETLYEDGDETVVSYKFAPAE